jgi:hypothetical protein
VVCRCAAWTTETAGPRRNTIHPRLPCCDSLKLNADFCFVGPPSDIPRHAHLTGLPFATRSSRGPLVMEVATETPPPPHKTALKSTFSTTVATDWCDCHARGCPAGGPFNAERADASDFCPDG